MKKNKNRVNLIRRFFMWIFGIKGAEKATPEMMNFEAAFEAKKDPLIIDFQEIVTSKKKSERKNQNLSDKYNKNVRRGKNGRYESLKK